MIKTKRTALYIKPGQRHALSRIAAQEGCTIDEAIDLLLKEGMERRGNESIKDLSESVRVFEQIKRHRDSILNRTGNIPLEINTVQILDQDREEQDAKIIANFKTDSH